MDDNLDTEDQHSEKHESMRDKINMMRLNIGQSVMSNLTTDNQK